MRFVVYGAGAIGGVVGARLHQSGYEVLLIARGAHHDAIAARGLTLETPEERVKLEIPVAPDPAHAAIEPGDVVLLTMKGQDTADALDALRAAGGSGVPVVCMQNGVENERVALRRFPRVYGAVVMSPTSLLEPGVVQAYATKLTGSIDVGCYPAGTDDTCEQVCAALSSSGYDSTPREDIMRYKHEKLLLNLGNAAQAVCGNDADTSELVGRARDEGREVLRAAGIEFEVADVEDMGGRWERWGVGEIDGRPRGGGSTWQSVVRGTGRIEVDYLNGEIVMRGRQLGIPTPVNELLAQLAWQTVLEGRQPGWLTPSQVLDRLL
ncbi:MAG TPA: 2-dehydropantoate 2-reductase [Solirubrobacteraceae bacterium]|nr:2-dehydropantoate 2-reductase [Solirubrobacteraceae bacterium]